MKLLIACLAANIALAAVFFACFWFVDIVTPKRGIHDEFTIAVIAIPGGLAICAAAFYAWYKVFEWTCRKLKA